MSEETPMLMYLNAHMAVNQMRTKNETEGKIGAKVLSEISVAYWLGSTLWLVLLMLDLGAKFSSNLLLQ
jgi:hypothetical protein